MEFEWDQQKNLSNFAKHKVSFELACLVFDDPLTAYKFNRVVDDEERWHAIGKVGDRHMLVVVHTYRTKDSVEVVRIISARRASSHERRIYEQE